MNGEDGTFPVLRIPDEEKWTFLLSRGASVQGRFRRGMFFVSAREDGVTTKLRFFGRKCMAAGDKRFGVGDFW